MKNREIISDSKDCEKIKAAVVLMTELEREKILREKRDGYPQMK